MAGAVERWLADLGLAQYAGAFADHEIAYDQLAELDDADLKEIGVAALGHRKRLLKAIGELGPGPAAAAAPGESRQDAERRQLAVLFCDLVGSTALSTRLDPEDLRELVARYHALVSSAVARFDGFAAQFMGDGVMAFFGYPRAHEDDAERAVRAALAVVDEVARLPASGEARLEVRVGIATGPVVVGELGAPGTAQENAAIGETPNLAARLQSIASPGAIVICEATRRLAAGSFDYEPLGDLALKGFASPALAWRVLGASARDSRFEARHVDGLSPMVGRDEELDLLQRRWLRAEAGEGQVVLVSAEAGVGKSRLVAALEERLLGRPLFELRYFCSPYHTESPLHPFIAQLGRAADLAMDDDEARIGKVRAMLHASGIDDAQDLALVCELLSVPTADRFPPFQGGPQQKKARTMEILAASLAGLSKARPVLLIFEDAHWADPTSLELLDLMLERVAALRVLVLVTFRPEFAAPWTGRPQVATMTLSRLGRREAATVVSGVAGGRPLPDELLQEILRRTDGVPLFIEELTRALLDGGHLTERAGVLALSGPLSALSVPATLQASLVSRLDGLPTGKSVAQIGAAIGREFGRELLAEVAGMPAPQLDDALDRLTGAGLLLRRGNAGAPTFLFKHALVQDAAYGTLLRARRQQLHGRIAQALEQRFPEIAERQPEVLARHLSLAGEAVRAIGAWVRASQFALSRSASAEAVAHGRAALELVATLAPGGERDRLELRVQVALGVASSASAGRAVPATLAAFERADKLGSALNDDGARAPILSGLASAHQHRGELPSALDVARRLLAHVQSTGRRPALCGTNVLIASILFTMGRFDEAGRHAQVALEHFDPEVAARIAWRTNNDADLGAAALCYLALSRLHAGHDGEARVLESQALARAAALGHPSTEAFALIWGAAMPATARRDFAALGNAADRLMRHPGIAAMPNWYAFGRLFAGRASIAAGRVDDGLREIEGAIAELDALENLYGRPGILGTLAEGLLAAGRADEAAGSLDAAIGLAERTGDRYYACELWRILASVGEAHPDIVPPARAEEALGHAIRVAREQGSILYQARATADLARRRAASGDPARAPTD